MAMHMNPSSIGICLNCLSAECSIERCREGVRYNEIRSAVSIAFRLNVRLRVC